MGDLDGDGTPETALLLTRDPGDPQQQVYLVIAAWKGDRIVNLATTLLGYQVKVKSFKVAGGKLYLDGSRSASARTAMMPVTLTFSRQGKRRGVGGAADVGRCPPRPHPGPSPQVEKAL